MIIFFLYCLYFQVKLKLNPRRIIVFQTTTPNPPLFYFSLFSKYLFPQIPSFPIVKMRQFNNIVVVLPMHQTQRHLIDKGSDYDYFSNPTVQSLPTFLNKFLFFNRLAMLWQYVSGIARQKLFRYNDDFHPVLSTNRILTKFARSPRRDHVFGIAGEIFRMQRRTIITLVVLSIIAGLTSLVPIYFQFILVKAVMGNTGQYYSLAVVAVVMFLRFILLNYVLNLSSNIALNIKIYLQNTFMQAVFACSSFSPTAKYLDVDLIAEAFYYMPYLITSQIIIFGDIVFVFLQVGVYGCIVLGIYVLLYIVIGICAKIALDIMRKNSGSRARREKSEKRFLSGLIRVALERVHEYVFRLLVVEKTLQTRQNLKINLLYIICQTLGEACVVLSNISLYALTHHKTLEFLSSYYSVLFMVTCFYPFRYSVYGLFTIVKAYEAFCRISDELKDVHKADLRTLPDCQHDRHIFAENVGDCFEYDYHPLDEDTQGERMRERERENSMVEETNPLRSLGGMKQGEVLMVLTRVDSQPTIFQFMQELIATKTPDRSLLMISASHFMLPLSLRDNILYYSPYDEERFREVLQITQLDLLPGSLWEEKAQLDQKCLKFNEWHQSRIELARALYADVDYLLLNKQNILDDLTLLSAVLADRRKRRKMTVVANNTHKFFFKLADRVLAIGRRGEMETGTYAELRMARKSLFNLMFLRHHEKVDHSGRVLEQRRQSIAGTLHVLRRDGEVHLQKSTFFQFFNFVHRKAEFVILLSLFLPVCFKYYLQYLIGTSVNSDILWRYLIFGLIYLVFIFNRGLVLCLYTNFSSLSLYRKICRKLKRLNAHQILQFYQRQNIDFDFHSRLVERNLVMDFEYGQSILIEIVVSFVIYCTGQQLYIAVAVPIIIGIVYINGFYAKNARAIYLLKLKQTKGVARMINTAVQRFFSISKSGKAADFNSAFHRQNSIETIYNCNIQWLETGVRTLAELIVWVCFVVFLIIMIYTVQNISIYTSLVSLGCSMFINLMYLNTFYLKAFRQMEISLYSLTLCINFLKHQPNPTPRQIMRALEPNKVRHIEYVHSITYRAVTLNFFRKICEKVTLHIDAGDRIVISGNSNTYKEYIFYLLDNKLFDSDQIRGDVVINGEVRREFYIDGLFYLHSDPIIPFIGTLFEALRYSKPALTEQHLDKQLSDFFEELDLQPIFSSSSEVQGLRLDQKQLLQVFRVVVIEQCKVLVIVSGFDNLDIVTRRKLTKWLMRRKSINIIIETTNLREMVELYPKQYVFERQQFRLQQEKDPNLKEVYLKRWDTMREHDVVSSSAGDQRDQKEFDSMLKIEIEKNGHQKKG